MAFDPKIPFLHDRPLALRQDRRLAAHVSQSTDDLAVAVHEAEQRVGDADLGAEVLDETLRLAEVVARDPRVEVVDGLELQAAVDKVQPRRAGHVHRGAQHLLRERLVRP